MMKPMLLDFGEETGVVVALGIAMLGHELG